MAELMSREDVVRFRRELEALSPEDLTDLVGGAGFRVAALPPGASPRTLAREVVQALAHGAAPGVDVVLSAFRAEYPHNPVVTELAARYGATAGPGDAPAGEVRREKVMVPDDPTFLDVAFLAVGAVRARSVCRIAVRHRRRTVSGTGSRIGTDLILTNHHVLFDWDDGEQPAEAVDAWFDDELPADGRRPLPRQVRCLPGTVVGEREHDWAVIRAHDPIPAEFPVLDLRGAQPPELGRRVCIVQHPLIQDDRGEVVVDGVRFGRFKKITFQHNTIRDVRPDLIGYSADTAEGSSGAPVFDETWRVVALHHGYDTAQPGSPLRFENQGSRIERVLERMAALDVAPPG